MLSTNLRGTVVTSRLCDRSTPAVQPQQGRHTCAAVPAVDKWVAEAREEGARCELAASLRRSCRHSCWTTTN